MLIHDHAREGNFSGVADELAKGIPIEARNPQSAFTPLMEAVSSQKASAAVVRLLVDRGADVNASATDEPIDAMKIIENSQACIEGITASDDAAVNFPKLDELKTLLARMKVQMPDHDEGLAIQKTVLSLALHAGNVDKVSVLLDAGADVRYQRPHGYSPLIDAVSGRDITRDPGLVPLIRLLVENGAELNAVSRYSESALSITSNLGRFDAVKELLAAGTDPGPLQWTDLMLPIALGSVTNVETQLAGKPDLSAKDFWSRTPWLLSLQTGDVTKAKLLLAAGAGRSDRGRCGKTPLMYPIVNAHHEMLRWLLSEGFDPDEADDFGSTPLMEAAGKGDTKSVQLLLDSGADLHRLHPNETSVIKEAANLDTIRLLVGRGANLNDISDEMRSALTRLAGDGRIVVSREEYFAAKTRRFGQLNPQRMDFPFWKAMVTSGAIAHAVRKLFDDMAFEKPVWTFRRFGKSINELPDGRIIEIAGEHEDYYDPDFCIYNDVVVHHGDGTFDIFGYPEDSFPPTDFHSATLAGNYIYVIGNLGYMERRQANQTPVYRLNTDTLEIEHIRTQGEPPGWISQHKATLTESSRIQISGGSIYSAVDGVGKFVENIHDFELDLGSMTWSRIEGHTTRPA